MLSMLITAIPDNGL